MVKNIRIHDETYDHLAKNVRYPDSMADTLDRLLGLKISASLTEREKQ